VARLPTTLWSQVLAAGRGASGALEELARRYLSAVYGFVRASGYTTEDAEDLTHEFFVSLLESKALEQADPSRGRFRAYLYGCLRHFMANEARARKRLKRGGGLERVSLEAAERTLTLHPSQDPRRHFDRQWAVETLSRAVDSLQRELSPTAAQVFSLAHGAAPPSHKEIAARLEMSEDAVAAALYRARRKLRERLLEEVRATVGDDGDVEEELRALFAALAGE
jgi:RNA polymerase sigma factor (sigma-70 family)